MIEYKVIVLSDIEKDIKKIEKAINDAYEDGYCDAHAEFDELGIYTEEEVQKIHDEACENGKKEGYEKGFEAAKQIYSGLTTISGVTSEILYGSETKCTDAVSHINI